MTVDIIIREAHELQAKLPRRANDRALHKLRNSLTHFRNIAPRMHQAGILILILNSRSSKEDTAQIMSNPELQILKTKAGSQRNLSTMFEYFHRIMESQAERLIVLSEDAEIRRMNHEFWHFIHNNMLSVKYRLRIKNAYLATLGNGQWLSKKRQKNREEEFFAVCGEFYLGDGFWRNTRNILKKKQPDMFDLIEKILANSSESFE